MKLDVKGKPVNGKVIRSVQQPIESEDEEQWTQTAFARPQQAPVSDRPQTAIPSLGSLDINRRAASARETNRPQTAAFGSQKAIGPGQQSPVAGWQAHEDIQNLAYNEDSLPGMPSGGSAMTQDDDIERQIWFQKFRVNERLRNKPEVMAFLRAETDSDPRLRNATEAGWRESR